MRTLLNRDEVHQVLTTNIQDWKKHADILEVQDLNERLTFDDLCVIRSSAFYDDLNDFEMEMIDILDRHFIDIDLQVFARETFFLIHNIYNN